MRKNVVISKRPGPCSRAMQVAGCWLRRRRGKGDPTLSRGRGGGRTRSRGGAMTGFRHGQKAAGRYRDPCDVVPRLHFVSTVDIYAKAGGRLMTAIEPAHFGSSLRVAALHPYAYSPTPNLVADWRGWWVWGVIYVYAVNGHPPALVLVGTRREVGGVRDTRTYTGSKTCKYCGTRTSEGTHQSPLRDS